MNDFQPKVSILLSREEIEWLSIAIAKLGLTAPTADAAIDEVKNFLHFVSIQNALVRAMVAE